MIIVVGKWEKKLIRLATILFVIAVFAASMPILTGIFYQNVPVFSGWMQDEHPSGNPMRVESQSLNPTSATPEFDQKVDQFVVKIQNFYHQEKE